MVSPDEKDYRLGKSASTRIADAQDAIMAALANHKDTFGALRAETRLSRTALAANLKKMYKEGEIDRKTDSEDYRVTRYSLTDKGLKRLRKQKTLQTLQELEITSLGDIMGIILGQMADMMSALTQVTENIESERGRGTALPQLRKEERAVFEYGLSGSLFGITPENQNTDYFEALKELLSMVRLVVAGEDVDIERLRKLPNLTFMFQFKRERLIEHYEKLKKLRDARLESAQ